MSTSEMEVGDIRYQMYELPSSLGENPSNDALGAFFSSWRWVSVCKIVNESSNNVTFNNPYKDKSGTIPAGKQESAKSSGWIPYSRTDKQYTVQYYHTRDKMWTSIGITDLDRAWMLSFKYAGVDVDEREVQPVSGLWSEIALIIRDDGFQIYSCDYKNIISSTVLRQPPR